MPVTNVSKFDKFVRIVKHVQKYTPSFIIKDGKFSFVIDGFIMFYGEIYDFDFSMKIANIDRFYKMISGIDLGESVELLYNDGSLDNDDDSVVKYTIVSNNKKFILKKPNIISCVDVDINTLKSKFDESPFVTMVVDRKDMLIQLQKLERNKIWTFDIIMSKDDSVKCDLVFNMVEGGDYTAISTINQFDSIDENIMFSTNNKLEFKTSIIPPILVNVLTPQYLKINMYKIKDSNNNITDSTNVLIEYVNECDQDCIISSAVVLTPSVS